MKKLTIIMLYICILGCSNGQQNYRDYGVRSYPSSQPHILYAQETNRNPFPNVDRIMNSQYMQQSRQKAKESAQRVNEILYQQAKIENEKIKKMTPKQREAYMKQKALLAQQYLNMQNQMEYNRLQQQNLDQLRRYQQQNQMYQQQMLYQMHELNDTLNGRTSLPPILPSY